MREARGERPKKSLRISSASQTKIATKKHIQCLGKLSRGLEKTSLSGGTGSIKQLGFFTKNEQMRIFPNKAIS
jgi:hypothetical protein